MEIQKGNHTPIVKEAIKKIDKTEIRFATKACGKCQLLNPLAKKVLLDCRYFDSEECTAITMRIIVGPDPQMIIKAYSTKLTAYLLNNNADNVVSTLKSLIKKDEHQQHIIDIIFSWFESVVANTTDTEDVEVDINVDEENIKESKDGLDL